MEALVVKLRAENRTWDYIGLATGRSASVCSDRYYSRLDPALQNWTPAMFAKLDEMVQAGVQWISIARALNTTTVACQRQWRILGKGKFRARGVMAPSQTSTWIPQEMEAFWENWLQYGGSQWHRIATRMNGRTAVECRDALRPATMSALKEAPGWVRLEAYEFVTDLIRIARVRNQHALKQDAEAMVKSGVNVNGHIRGKKSAWTEEEHAALLNEVEKHGLFSDWTVIRKQVKPNCTDDEVEAEYYRLNGVGLKTGSSIQDSSDNDNNNGSSDSSDKSTGSKSVSVNDDNNDDDDDDDDEDDDAVDGAGDKRDFVWTQDETERLNLILMKYSTMPIWRQLALKHGVTPQDGDDTTLFEPLPSSFVGMPSKTLLSKKLSRRVHRPSADAAVESEEDRHLPPWTQERVRRLKKLMSQQQQQHRVSGQPVNWAWIADHIGPGFDENMCVAKWQTIPASRRKISSSSSTFESSEDGDEEAHRFWEESDMEKLESGILAFGRKWSMIQAHFLPARSTDSIRRKVSNLQRRRDMLVKECTAAAKKIRKQNRDLDVQAFVQDTIKDDPVYIATKRLEDLMEQYKKTGKVPHLRRTKQERDEAKASVEAAKAEKAAETAARAIASDVGGAQS
ncbi:hypothetical protein BGZ98_002042 [Dissophora globulifera]|nr:hypothetical protein BGZ98_002042 [Dissophora globulifera]